MAPKEDPNFVLTVLLFLLKKLSETLLIAMCKHEGIK